MNAAHFHLLVNHLPVIGILIGILVLLAGFAWKQPAVKATSAGIFVFSALGAIAAFLSGEGAEEAVEGMSGVSETLIHHHEEMAKLFLGMAVGLGVVSVAALVLGLRRSGYARWLYLLLLLLGLGNAVAAGMVASSGGEIRHPEARGQVLRIEFSAEEGDD
jgi:formate hydrogenlyase subunit 3/multisubunit Na+/H+ antiporter MnhD subunit